MIIPVILAGGSGSRLWPLSRRLYPKQFMRLTGDDTMLQLTIKRFEGVSNVGSPMVICNTDHRFMVAEQLHEMGIPAPAIILEPVGRNTAPAVAAAALLAMNTDKDAVLLILPADHHIEDVPAFQAALATGARLASDDRLITFGIVPQAPETGYGYIRKGSPLSDGQNGSPPPTAFAIEAFVEKPDMETARRYLSSGEYLWNAGIFMFKASQVLKEFEQHAPDILNACREAVLQGREDLDFFRLDRAAFEACREDSIDYAIMEKTVNGTMVPLDAGWNDLGSWEALWQVGRKDDNQNVIKGDVINSDVKHSYLHATHRLVAAVGLENHIVVESSDAVMISPRNRVQDVKRLVEKMKACNRDETIAHKTDYRPWGSYESIQIDERFQVKRVTVKPGAKMSLQRHYHRAEHWIVVHGTALVTKGDDQFVLKEDQSTYIPLGVPHRLENAGKLPLEIIEVQTGSYLADDDIVRLDDIYGRSD